MVTTRNHFIAQLFAALADRGLELTEPTESANLAQGPATFYKVANAEGRCASVLIIDQGEQGYRLFIETPTLLYVEDIEQLERAIAA